MQNYVGIDWKDHEFGYGVQFVTHALWRLGILVAVSFDEYSVPQPIPVGLG